MRKIATTAFLTAAAAATAISLSSSPALADPTWTVGPESSGSVDFTADSTTNLVLTDNNTHTQLTCTTSSGTGDAVYGSGQSGDDLANVDDLSFGNCSGPAGITFTVQSSGFAWALNADSYDGVDTTTGSISGVTAHLSGPLCSADVAGSVPMTYSNDGTLSATGGSGLTITNVSGCLGLIKNNDTAGFVGSYAVDPAVTITSP
ncbi:hypothetical protein GCM10023191_000150 [Actinoallomurus oryzae]|jgi:hypothetical protein|uniref:Secreted protein n=1 Tax=Actinoallomurus oryzae TaxID=502180 RepID=A0ABP8P3J1_9ACTN